MSEKATIRMGVGLVMGIGFGVAISNIGLGIALGVAIGAAFSRIDVKNNE